MGTEYMVFGVGGAGDGANPPTERMRIAGNGNVGIGTTNPQAKLDVNGTMKLGNMTLASRGTCGSNTYGVIYFDTTEKRPYICTNDSNTWKPLDSDYDKDGITDAIDTNDNNASDATAKITDVRAGKTFYAGGTAKTGTIANCLATNNIGKCYISQSTKSGLDTDLIAGNIAKGVNIFGVTGTLAGSNSLSYQRNIGFSMTQGVSTVSLKCSTGYTQVMCGCGGSADRNSIYAYKDAKDAGISNITQDKTGPCNCKYGWSGCSGAWCAVQGIQICAKAP